MISPALTCWTLENETSESWGFLAPSSLASDGLSIAGLLTVSHHHLYLAASQHVLLYFNPISQDKEEDRDSLLEVTLMSEIIQEDP